MEAGTEVIAQKCMRRLWFVEDGETNVIFRGKGAKTRAMGYAALQPRRGRPHDDFEKAPPLCGPWQKIGPTLDEYVSPPPSYQSWEVT